MEQNADKTDGKESRIPLLSTAGGWQKSRVFTSRPSHVSSKEDWNNEKMDCEPFEKEVSVDSISEYWNNLIGQRVCIGGVKNGILRYYGKTQFANGIWCGVELDEAVGKNDGTVDGVQYFTCKANFGIFAPVSKVEKIVTEDVACDVTHPEMLETKRVSSMVFPSIKSKLPPPKITAKNIISKIMDTRCTESSDENFFQKDDESKIPTFQYYGKRTKLSSESSDVKDFGINSKSQTVNIICDNRLDADDFSRCIYEDSPEHFAKRSRMCTEMKSQSLDVTVSLQDHCLKQTDSSSSLKDLKNGQNLNCTFNMSSPTLTENSLIEELNNETRSLNRTFSLNELLDKSDKILSNRILESNGYEDDQISLDLDESLGILTPNQMKDFTICLDNQNSGIIESLNIPNSESCDGINEIPEYEEIQGIVIEYTPENVSGVQVSVTSHTIQPDDSVFLPPVEEPISNIIDKLKYKDSITSSRGDKGIENIILNNESRYDTVHSTKQSEYKMSKHITVVNDTCIQVSENISLKQTESEESIINNKKDMLTHLCDTTTLLKSDLQSRFEICKDKCIENETYKKNSSSTMEKSSLFDVKDTILNNKSADIPRDKINSHVKLYTDAENLQVCDLIENRPISLHTLGSTDTGYQEDGEFDNHSELGCTINDMKRFSTCSSHDSCGVFYEINQKKDDHQVTDSGIVLSAEGDEIFDQDEEKEMTKIVSNISVEQEECNLGNIQSQSSVKKVDISQLNKLERWPMEESDESCHMFEKTISLDQNELKKLSHKDIDTEMDITICEEPVETTESIQDETVVEKSDSQNIIPARSPSIIFSDMSVHKTPTKSKDSIPKKDNEKDKISLIDSSDKKSVNKTPKKNVMSKIKAMIESTASKTRNKDDTEQAKKNIPKKSRWEAVTSKIAASLAEEKSKPKVKKEIKSKIDTNLCGARQPLVKRSFRSDFSKANSSFGNDDDSESSRTMRNTFDQKRSVDTSVASSVGSTEKCIIETSQEKQNRQTGVSKVQKRNHQSKSPLCGASSRSASPAARSESSTVSVTSHRSSKNAISKQRFHGSSSTLGSTSSNHARKPSTAITPTVKHISVTTTHQKKPATKPKIKPCQPPSYGKSSTQILTPKPPVWTTRVELAQEIQRLGVLCETRTKELNHLKMQLKHASLGFDSFVVLVRYLTEELDAFSQPRIVSELEKTREELNKAEKCLQQYQNRFEEMKERHSCELVELTEKLNQTYQEAIQELTNKHNTELQELKYCHEQQLAEMFENHMKQYEEAKNQHTISLLELKQDHSQQVEEMKRLHADELEEIESNHQQTRMMLNNQLKELEQQCKDLKYQAKLVEEALHRDTDTKIQWISAKKADLEKEVDSLKTVLDMKKNEIHSLRKENLEMKKELEKLPIAKEKIKMLEAKAEDLQAMVNQKVQNERQLTYDHEYLKESYEKESKVNKRLSMENEELLWKLKQNAEANLLLHSISGSPEVLDRLFSPIKSPAKQSVSLPMFFHNMEENFTDIKETSLQSLPNSSSQCKKSLISPRKCSSPIRTPSFVAASPPAPCARKCKTDTKPTASPHKQKRKSFSGEKSKSSSKETDLLLELSDHDLIDSVIGAKTSSKPSASASDQNGFHDCSHTSEMDHNNEVFLYSFEKSNNSAGELYSARNEEFEKHSSLEHGDCDILRKSKKSHKRFEDSDKLEKLRDFTLQSESSTQIRDISNNGSFPLIYCPPNMSCSYGDDISSRNRSPRSFLFDDQHFSENGQSHFDELLSKKDNRAQSSPQSLTDESVVTNQCDNSMEQSTNYYTPENDPEKMRQNVTNIPQSTVTDLTNMIDPIDQDTRYEDVLSEPEQLT